MEHAEPAQPVVHHNIICDASGMGPIMGVRYKKKGEDYDLCDEEFLKLPYDSRAQYIRIPHPDAKPTQMALALLKLAGQYECHKYDDEEGKNEWHYADVTVADGPHPALTWTNRAGVSWSLSLQEKDFAALDVAQDCPYFEL